MKTLLIFYELIVSIFVLCLVFASAPTLSTYPFFGALVGFLALAFMFCGATITIFGYVMYAISLLGEKK